MQLPELANRVKQFQRNIRPHVGHNGFESEWGEGGSGVLTQRGGVSGAEHVAQAELPNQIPLNSV